MTCSRCFTSSIAASLGAATLSAFLAGAVSAQQFTIQDLGDLGVPLAFAEDINEGGDVVGYSYVIGPSGHSEDRAFLWLAESAPELGLGPGMHDLGTLGGEFSRATGVNDLRQVSGYTGYFLAGPGPIPTPPTPPPPGVPVFQGFLWSGGTMKGLRVQPETYPFTFSARVNNKAQVVGDLYEDVATVGFVWLPESDHAYAAGMNVLEGPLPHGNAYDINDAGEIAGRFSGTPGSGESGAAVWLPEAAYGLPAGPNYLPIPGMSLSETRALNDRGTFVGAGLLNGDLQIFIWREGVTTFLFSTPDFAFAYPLDVNNRGEIVGYGEDSPLPAALLWRSGEPPIDLNTVIPEGTGWRLERANAINDRGQIVGNGTVGGLQRAFLLTPVPIFTDGFESGDLNAWD